MGFLSGGYTRGLGRGVRRVIPSCAIWKKNCHCYPEEGENTYVPFQEATDEITALQQTEN